MSNEPENPDDFACYGESLARYPWEPTRKAILSQMEGCQDGDKLVILEILRIEILHDLFIRKPKEAFAVAIGQAVTEALYPSETPSQQPSAQAPEPEGAE